MSLSLLKKKSFVGIDIGHASIKAVQLEKLGGGWKISRAGQVPTPSDSIREGTVIDPATMGMAIKGLLRTAKITANTAIVGVSGSSIIVRNVKFPKMNELMLRKSIKYEAGRYVPSSVEDSYIECEVGADTEDGQMEVLIVAAPKELVNSRIRACRAADLEVDCVDIDAFALFRSLVESEEASILRQMTMALVDVGFASTTVSVISKGQFVMTRSIPQASQVVTEALKTYFKLSTEDAEKGKAQLDLAPLMNDQAIIENPPLRVIQPHVDDLVREVRRSLNYYQSQQTESGQPNPVSHLMVSGGGAQLKNLGQYMSHKLGIQVVNGSVLESSKFAYAGMEDPGPGQQISVATGLAMRGFAKTA